MPLVECDQVSRTYTVERNGERRIVKALDRVSLALDGGRTLGIVGESGSGKSTLGQIAAALSKPSGGEVRISGRSTTRTDRRGQRELRRRLQIIWQDPLSSMNVHDTIETIVTEAPIAHGLFGRQERRKRAEAIVESVGLPGDVLIKRPTQLSGGQLQRIAIGRALALEPELVVCDEVTSALDVSVQAQILNLLHDVQQRTGVAYLFISHDLQVVKHVSDTVAVMYAGRIVETGNAATIYADPQHPYTQQLVRATRAELDPGTGEMAPVSLAGEHCSYAPLCPLRQPICLAVEPQLALSDSGSLAACHVRAPAFPAASAAS